MKRFLLFAALGAAFCAAAAEVPVPFEVKFSSRNQNISGSRDAKSGVITYTISKDGFADKNGKKNVWHSQAFLMAEKGLPAGNYTLRFNVLCSAKGQLQLLVFNKDGRAGFFGKAYANVAANQVFSAKVPFQVSAANANQPFRLLCIPTGLFPAGTKITISDLKVLKP